MGGSSIGRHDMQIVAACGGPGVQIIARASRDHQGLAHHCSPGAACLVISHMQAMPCRCMHECSMKDKPIAMQILHMQVGSSMCAHAAMFWICNSQCWLTITGHVSKD